MMSLRTLFHDHPASVNETYGQHFAHAGGFGIRMILGGFACLLHGIFPFLFVKTGSAQVTVLHDRMVTNRTKPLPGILDFVI
jgi:hypothetical protein